MSIQSEITRLETAKSDIATAITNKGVTVPSGMKLDGMAALIGSIESGEANFQTKSVMYTENGTSTITPDDGYDGLSSVDVTVNVASGGGGGAGFKVTFPATATNWKQGNIISTSAFLWLSDGTLISMGSNDYSNVAGKAFDGVIGLYVENSIASHVPRITLMGSVIVNGISSAFGITTDGATPARFGMPNKLIFLFLSDATISSIEIYNTD